MVRLIETKLQAPPLRQERVLRPRLYDRLTDLEGRIVLVSAPPGFGKSTFVVEWLEAGRRPFAWYSLDHFDNDPVLFGEYLGAALSRLTHRPSGLRSAFGEPAVDARSMISALIDDVQDAPAGSSLVLDDYHAVDNIEIHEAVAYLIEHVPKHVNLVMITRADPPLPLTRLRATGRLVDIRADQLRFTASEIGDYFRQSLGLELTKGETDMLAQRSEGWVAALQLVSLGHEPVTGNDLVGALSASHKHISSYLIEEVLSRLSPALARFLLDTSVLDRFDVELCRAITNNPDPGHLIDELEQRNAFLIPLTEEPGGWYRYHHLFAELLRSRLRRTDPTRETVLLEAAARHCDERGLPDDGIEYALRIGDLTLAGAITDRHSAAQLAIGGVGRLRSWLSQFPVPAGPATGVVTIGWAWCRVFEGNTDAAYALLEQVEANHLSDFPSDISGQLEIMRAMTAFQAGDPAEAEAYARNGLQLLPRPSQYMECLGHLYVGRSLYARSRWNDAREHLSRAANLADHGNLFAAVTALFWLGATEADTGDLVACEHSMRQAQQLSASDDRDPDLAPAAGIADVGMAYVRLNQMDIAGAVKLAQRGTELLERTTFAEMVFRAYFVWAEALSLDGRHEESESVAAAGIDWLRGRHMSGGPLEAWLWMSQSRNATRQGRYDEADRVLDKVHQSGLGGSADVETVGFFEAAAMLSLAMRSGDIERSRRLFAGLPPLVPGYVPFEIERHVLTAGMHELNGEGRAAVAALEQAIDMASRGYRYQFSHIGPVIRPVLARMVGRTPNAEFVQSLLDRIPTETGGRRRQLVETLTPRELDVLREIASGYTNAAIAERLFISHGTVKRHTANIYMKLGVHHRAEAAARGREFGLLD